MMQTIQFSKPWNICQPAMFRFMSRQHVREFFATGELQLSSFQKFRENDDETRLDGREGTFQYECHTVDTEGTPQHIMSKGRIEENAYVLCGSMSNAARSTHDAYLSIQNTLHFASIVAHHLPGFIGGMEGACLYVASRRIERSPMPVKAIARTDSAEAEAAERARMEQYLRGAIAHFPYFVKHVSFMHEIEYRLLWFVDHRVTGYKKVYVPEAREVCHADERTMSDIIADRASSTPSRA